MSMTADIGVYGPCDDMGERHPDGEYINITVNYKNGDEARFRISLGAAGFLVDEINGVLRIAAVVSTLWE